MKRAWIVLALVAMTLSAAPAGASAAVVTKLDLTSSWPPSAAEQWYVNAAAGNATATFGVGPATPPEGDGSLRLYTDSTDDKVYVQNAALAGVPLAALQTVSFSTWSNRSTVAPVFQVRIYRLGTSGFSTVNFEPYMNGTVVPNTWQDWSLDPATTRVWLSGVGTSEGSQSQPVTWARLLELFPAATIVDGIALNAGSGWAGVFTGAVDNVTLGLVDELATTYDFEQPSTVTAPKVSPTDVGVSEDWHTADTRLPGALSFSNLPGGVVGPGAAVLATGTATDGGAKVQLFTDEHDDTLLRDITELSYSTKLVSGPDGSVVRPAINMRLDRDADGDVDAYLVYEPYADYGNAALSATEWQTWDAWRGGQAKWWSGHISECPQSTGCTIKTLLATYPNAVIQESPDMRGGATPVDADFQGSFGLNQGSGNPGVVGAADALRIAVDADQDGTNEVDATYDFAEDSTPPVITSTLIPATPDGENGWYTSDVSLSWGVTELESLTSLDTTGCDAASVIADQAATAYSCAASSDGGSAGPVQVTIKRDATPPAVSVTGVTDGSAYNLGAVPVAGCTTTDTNGSGVATSATVSAVSNTTIGAKTVSCTGAEDLAGNGASASAGYLVQYPFSGFAAPISNTGVNTAKAGKAVQLTFSLGGNRGSNIFAAGFPKLATCTATPSLSAAKGSLSYSGGPGTYTYVWKSDKSPLGCLDLVMTFVDQRTATVRFNLTK